jgi:hypothetical protein
VNEPARGVGKVSLDRLVELRERQRACHRRWRAQIARCRTSRGRRRRADGASRNCSPNSGASSTCAATRSSAGLDKSGYRKMLLEASTTPTPTGWPTSRNDHSSQAVQRRGQHPHHCPTSWRRSP